MEKAVSIQSADAFYRVDYKLQEFDSATNNWITRAGFRNVFDRYLASNRLDITSLASLVHSSATNDATRNLFDYGSFDAVKEEAVTKVNAKLSDSDAMSLVTLGEADDTVRLLRTAGVRMGRAVSALRRFSLTDLATLRRMDHKEISALGGWYKQVLRSRDVPQPNFKRSIGRVSQRIGKLAASWLEARYGWQSLFYELEAYCKVEPSTRGFHRVVANGSQIYNPDPVTTISDSAAYNGIVHSRLTRTSSRSRSSTVQAGVIVKTNPTFAGIDSVGARRVFSSAWELVPFSFVIDWFVNVGDKLAAVDSHLITQIVGSWVSTRHKLEKFEYYYDGLITPGNPNWRVSGYYQNLAQLWDSCDHTIREVNPSVSVLPEITLRVNPTRVADAVALLRVNSRRLTALLRGK